jgi:hypothetical protein
MSKAKARVSVAVTAQTTDLVKELMIATIENGNKVATWIAKCLI